MDFLKSHEYTTEPKKSIHSSCWVFPEADPKARIIFMHFIEK